MSDYIFQNTTFSGSTADQALELGSDFKTARGGLVAVDAKKGIVEAFAAAIGNKDSVGDIIVPGAFNESLRRRKPRVVWGHDWNKPIGKVLEIYEVGPKDPRLPMKMRANGVGGLYVKVQFNLNSERGRQAFADVDFFGEEQEWSIGYKTIDKERDHARNATILKQVELYEVSPVLHGANQLTGTLSVKDATLDEEIEVLEKLQAQIGEYDFSGEIDEKAGRRIASRNMVKLRKALELLQEVVSDGTLPEALEQKFDEKSIAGQFEAKADDADDLVFGESSEVSAVTIVVKADDRDGVAQVLDATSDLVCCKGFMVKAPSNGGDVVFYLPGSNDVREATVMLKDALSGVEGVAAEVEVLGGHSAKDVVPIGDLFTDPDSVG